MSLVSKLVKTGLVAGGLAVLTISNDKETVPIQDAIVQDNNSASVAQSEHDLSPNAYGLTKNSGKAPKFYILDVSADGKSCEINETQNPFNLETNGRVVNVQGSLSGHGYSVGGLVITANHVVPNTDTVVLFDTLENVKSGTVRARYTHSDHAFVTYQSDKDGRIIIQSDVPIGEQVKIMTTRGQANGDHVEFPQTRIERPPEGKPYSRRLDWNNFYRYADGDSIDQIEGGMSGSPFFTTDNFYVGQLSASGRKGIVYELVNGKLVEHMRDEFDGEQFSIATSPLAIISSLEELCGKEQKTNYHRGSHNNGVVGMQNYLYDDNPPRSIEQRIYPERFTQGRYSRIPPRKLGL